MSVKNESDAPVLRSPRFPSSKFSTPKMAPGFVRRPRLLDELDRGRQAGVTLVVGLAGGGKTRLLADWLAARPRPRDRVAELRHRRRRSGSVRRRHHRSPSTRPPDEELARTPVKFWAWTGRIR